MRKKKILLTFSKSRNRKLYSYTFNIYGAYRLLRYKAMIFYKCSSQDGTVNRLTGSHLGVRWQRAACFSISTVPCKQNRLSAGARGQRGGGAWGGAWGGLGAGTSPEKSHGSCSGLLGRLLLVRSWRPHQAEGRLGNVGRIPRKALTLQKSTRGILGPGAELPVSVRRTSCMGILLATSGRPCWTPAFFCANSG